MNYKELYNLIHKMKISEKRYFKLNELQKKNSNHIKLFNFLNQLKDFDIEAIKSYININFKSQNSSQIKSSLVNKLLLNSYDLFSNNNKNKRTEAQKLIRIGKSAIRKGNLDWANKVFIKIEEICNKYEFTEMHLHIIDYQINIYLNKKMNSDKDIEKFEKLCENYELLSDQNLLLTKYKKLYGRVLFWHNHNKIDNIKIEKTLQLNLLKEEKLANTHLLKYCHYNTLAFLNLFKSNPINSLFYFEKLYNNWNEDDEFKLEYSRMFITISHNYLSCLIENKKLEKCQSLLPEFRNFILHKRFNKDIRAAAYLSHYLIRMQLQSIKTEVNISELNLTELKSDLDKLKSSLSWKQSIDFFYNLLIIIQKNNDYKLIYDWLKNIESILSFNIVKDSKASESFIILLYAISLYETNSWKFLKYEIERINYKINTSEENFEELNLLISFIKKSTGKLYKKNPLKYLNDFKIKIDNQDKELKKPLNYNQNHTIFNLWLEQKLTSLN